MVLGLLGVGACPRVALEPELRAVDEAARSGLLTLEVEGFLPALLFVPSGAEPRPLVVAAHGAGGRPEWDCENWRRLTKGQAFVLCLRGTSMGKGGGYYYRDQHALEAELKAAEAAARALEPRILPTEGLYTGFSQGSSMGSAMVAAHGGAFPYLALIEGFERWNIARAKAFVRAGGKRVLFVCGTKNCRDAAQESLPWLKKGGVVARLEYAAGAGHTFAGDVRQRVEQALPWLWHGEPQD
jgi:predicted esterase